MIDNREARSFEGFEATAVGDAAQISCEAAPFGPPSPWPKGHVPASPCEKALWISFEELRADSHSHLTQQIVATRIGRSRTSISMGVTKGYALLREAIKDEKLRRRDARRVVKAGAPVKLIETPAQREERLAVRRGESLAHFKAVAQRADSAVIAANVGRIRAERAAKISKATVDAIFADFKAGRWVRADGGGDAAAELETMLRDLLSGLSGGGDERADGDDVAAIPRASVVAVAPSPLQLPRLAGRPAAGTTGGPLPWRRRA